MKISIVMPTYNDSKSICESLDSVVNQTFDNWELIIIDDGSTDSTKQVIQQYKEKYDSNNKIQYHYQENSDQLNAIKSTLKYVSGDYIYILHSDDLFCSGDSLKNFVDFEKANPGYDAYTGNYIIINENSDSIGDQKTIKYINKTYRLALLYLWLGRNLYIDVAFFKADIYKSSVKDAYLNWNMPYWLDFSQDIKMLNVKNMNLYMFKYRIHGENYINNYIGKLNVINGELRTVTRLMNYVYIPFYKYQYFAYRCFNKLRLSNIFRPMYFKCEEKNKGEIIEFIIRKRFDNNYKENLFLDYLVKFYKSNSSRTININNINDDTVIFYGSDIKKFNKMLIDKNLPEIYYKIISEMKDGFAEISCYEKDKSKIKDILKFLCIYPYVKLTIKKHNF